MGNIAAIISVLGSVASNYGTYRQLGVDVMDLVGKARDIVGQSEPTDDDSRRQLEQANALVAQLQGEYAAELESLRERSGGAS